MYYFNYFKNYLSSAKANISFNNKKLNLFITLFESFSQTVKKITVLLNPYFNEDNYFVLVKTDI